MSSSAYSFLVDLLIHAALVPRAEHHDLGLVGGAFELLDDLGELGVGARAVVYFHVVVLAALRAHVRQPRETGTQKAHGFTRAGRAFQHRIFALSDRLDHWN